MGFVLSILYFVTNYLTPSVVFGPLAPFHIEVILAVLIFFVSLPALMRSFILKTPQSLALIGLATAAFMSVLIEEHWPGGAVQAFLDFIPSAFAYFLVCLHCNSKRKLQVLVLMLLFVCLFVIVHGNIDLHRGVSQNGPLQTASTESGDLNHNLWKMEHPYLDPMKNNAGAWIYRLRGLGEINDPNDFAQLTLCLIPLMFIFWRAKKTLRNIAFVILPVSVLLVGVFQTQSRGALLALIAVAVVAVRRRIGTMPALLLAGVIFFAAMALHFTGGREISADSGADRLTLWGDGLQMLKTHPLFGVGYGKFMDFAPNTAHNSVVVCAAELGLFGLYFWSFFLLPTARDVLAIASPANVREGEPILLEEGPFQQMARKLETVDKAEINRLGRLLVLSLTGFLVAGWFLSRAYVITFFLLGGMIEVVFEMALQRGMIAPRLRLARVFPYAGGLTISLLLLVYIMLRILNLMR